MLKLTINKKPYTLPESFNEASPEALLAFLEKIWLKRRELFVVLPSPSGEGQGEVTETDPIAFRKAGIAILKASLQRVTTRKAVNLQISSFLFFRFSPAQLVDLLLIRQVNNFWYQENALTKNPYHALSTLHSQQLLGPADNFQSLVFIEFSFADTYFMRAIHQLNNSTTQQLPDLDTFIAILYRHKKIATKDEETTADQRTPFNIHTVENRMKLVSKIPFLQKLAILFWFEGCKNALRKRYPLVFSPSPSGVPRERNEGEPTNWMKIMLSMAGSTLGDINQVHNQPVETVFAEMQRQAENRIELEKLSKK